MNRHEIADPEALGLLPAALAAFIALSSDALLDQSTGLLDALDRTGLGIGVRPGHRDRLRKELAFVLILLASRREEDAPRLRRRERALERARGLVDDYTFVVIEMALRRDRAALHRASRPIASPFVAGEPCEPATLDGALARYATMRRAAAGRASDV